MKAFLKENIVLVAGIALPLLLTVIFFAATQFDKLSIEDPQFSLLYSNKPAYYDNSERRVIIKNNKAYLSYIPRKNPDMHKNQDNLELYLYNPTTKEKSLISLPDIEGIKDRKEIPIEELKSSTISTNSISPDGYEFGRNYRRSGNLMTEVLGANQRSHSNIGLTKGSRIHVVPETQYYNVHFIGWIIPKD